MINLRFELATKNWLGNNVAVYKKGELEPKKIFVARVATSPSASLAEKGGLELISKRDGRYPRTSIIVTNEDKVTIVGR